MITYIVSRVDAIKKVLLNTFKDWKQYGFDFNADKGIAKARFIDREGQRYEVIIRALIEGGDNEEN